MCGIIVVVVVAVCVMCGSVVFVRVNRKQSALLTQLAVCCIDQRILFFAAS